MNSRGRFRLIVMLTLAVVLSFSVVVIQDSVFSTNDELFVEAHVRLPGSSPRLLGAQSTKKGKSGDGKIPRGISLVGKDPLEIKEFEVKLRRKLVDWEELLKIDELTRSRFLRSWETDGAIVSAYEIVSRSADDTLRHELNLEARLVNYEGSIRAQIRPLYVNVEKEVLGFTDRARFIQIEVPIDPSLPIKVFSGTLPSGLSLDQDHLEHVLEELKECKEEQYLTGGEGWRYDRLLEVQDPDHQVDHNPVYVGPLDLSRIID